jgi:hypothetical protein
VPNFRREENLGLLDIRQFRLNQIVREGFKIIANHVKTPEDQKQNQLAELRHRVRPLEFSDFYAKRGKYRTKMIGVTYVKSPLQKEGPTKIHSYFKAAPNPMKQKTPADANT